MKSKSFILIFLFFAPMQAVNFYKYRYCLAKYIPEKHHDNIRFSTTEQIKRSADKIAADSNLKTRVSFFKNCIDEV